MSQTIAPDPTRPVHVLVPLKRLDGAKSRLSRLLSPAERAALMRAMLADVLVAVRTARGVGPITLVSSEPSAAALAREHGVEWWDDRGLAWNDALAQAMREVVAEPCAAVVSADLPLLVASEVEALLLAVPVRGITVARASDGGTNAVCLRPPGALVTCFGTPDSAARHLELAQGAGLQGVLVDQPGTALDIDSPEDVERFLAAGRPGETRTLLATLALGERRAATLADAKAVA